VRTNCRVITSEYPVPTLNQFAGTLVDTGVGVGIGVVVGVLVGVEVRVVVAVGVNVGIPVPLGMFGFTGHKNSFFGDLHCMGRDGVQFYTESKSVTYKFLSGGKQGKVARVIR